MSAASGFIAEARIDAQERLVAAGEPLASFHLRCGGELPGPLLTPGLIELVREARAWGLSLARPVKAQDEREDVTMWAEARPDAEGCTLLIGNWRTEPLRAPGPAQEQTHRIEMARHLAELSARLSPRQELQAVVCDSAELAALAERMRAGLGRAWTDFVELEGNAHRQPLHWRLLDGARLRLAGSTRRWTATLVPLGIGDAGSQGFELLLHADQPPPAAPASEPARGAALGRNARPPGIGHDLAPVLRQPVSRIIANAETIRTRLAGPLADEYSRYAADIAAAGEHLLALIDDLATLDMIEDEAFSPAADRIDLADVARRAAGILGVRARERGIVLDPPRPGESVPAIGEFRRVLQVLLNLVGNAIRHSPAGGQVWIRAELEGDRAQVVVADQGEGLSPVEQQRVFAKFERLGRSDDGGSGLGLYISRRLAHAMGGALTVESAKGRGARFTLDLPADPEAGDA